MSCRFCCHYLGTLSDENAECTRYPTWKTVQGNHFCGEIRPELSKYHKAGSTTESFYQQMHQFYAEWQATNKRRIEADKKIKELRRQLREKKP